MISLLGLLLIAQVVHGSRSDETANSAAKSREIMASFGMCIAKKRTDLAREFVLNPASPVQSELFKDSLATYCMPMIGSLRFQPIAARGVMAEYLIGKEFPGMPEIRTDVASPTAVTESSEPASSETRIKIISMGDITTELGTCLVKADQSKARALLASKVNSKEEASSVQALVPVIGGCTIQGMRVQIDATGLRTGIAVGYYLLARASIGEAK